MLSAQLTYVIGLLIVALATLGFTVNHFIKRKLRLTLFLLVVAVLFIFARRTGLLEEETARLLGDLDVLLMVLATINYLVTVSVNPLRADRISPRFPNIVQDAITVGLFMIVATVVMREKFLTTSAVGAVVVGFALQDTLGNAFAGLAIQIEKPFYVGHWIRIGEHEGRVEEITWRATKVRTKADTFVIIPNNVLSKEAIINYSEPVLPTRLSVEVGASYLAPPNTVKSAIMEAIANAPLALANPAPDVILLEFGSSSIVYRARFWLRDYALDAVAMDQVRTGIYYSFRRHDIEIPWPIEVQYHREFGPDRAPGLTERFSRLIAGIDVFAGLDPEEQQNLASLSEERVYAAGETVFRQGQPGNSMFIVCSGTVRVTAEPSGRKVAQIGAGGYFGEMSLLTGDPRAATITAVTDCVLMEITGEAFRRFVMPKPAVVEPISTAVLKRRSELEQSLSATGVPSAAPTSVPGFLAYVRRFLGVEE